MKHGIGVRLMMVGMFIAAAAAARAEVKTEEKSQIKMEGMMGRVMGMFGGKAAKEGVINTVAVKGNRKMTTSDTAGEIIDLDEKKVYSLDMKKKTYEVMTFEEMRKRMQETQEKAEKMAKEQEPKKEQPSGKEMEFDFSLKESGQTKTINGYDCREVIMTITAREKGRTLEQSGGMLMTSHIWLGPKIPAMKEISDFDQRYYETLQGPMSLGGSAEQMAMATAMYPGMKGMLGKMQNESVNMDGTAILTEMTMEAVRTQEQMSQERQQEKEPSSITSIGGIGGMLGRRLGKKKEKEEGTAQPKNQQAIMTMNHELVKVVTSVTPADISIPAGFKEKK